MSFSAFRSVRSRSSSLTLLIPGLLLSLSALADKPQAPDQDTQSLEVLTVAQADQAGSDQAAAEGEEAIEEVVVVGTQIKGAAISDALSVSVIDAQQIEGLGISSGDELLDYMPEQGQNFFNEAENISGGVNAARGDIGAFNLRNMGTGNTLVLLNGRRLVNAAGYQTEEVGGSFVPVNSVNANAIPVYGIERVEVLRDGASAIYGADAVAGVINEVMKKDFEGLTVRGRYDWYDNIPRNDIRANLEWGKFFNEGRTNIGVFADFYHRDRVNSQDDEKWADADFRRLIPEGSPWFGDTAFRNNSANSSFGQYDVVVSVNPRSDRDRYGLIANGITDTAGEFETYPIGDPRCEGGFIINDTMCGHPDGQGTYRYNLNENRDLVSELDRYNLFFYLNHDFGNGIEAYTELSWYEAKTNQFRHPSASFSSSELRLDASSYYNPLGPCGSPNRLPDSVIGTDVPCDGLTIWLDNYRYTEVPRIVDTDNHTYRVLQGFRGVWGDWDWDTALVWSKAERDDVTHNRVSNTLIQEALSDPTPAGYNPFHGFGAPSNIERALVDVYRHNESELKMIDFKLSNPEIFNLPAGPVGFLAGAEYRDESYVDDRDPRLDGTIQFTDWEGDTYPYVSDVVNSSPTPDSSGGRDVTSLFTEFAVPVWDSDTPFVGSLDAQLALRYEDFSDVGDTTVGKFAFGWRPFEPLLIRGSWSEAFRAPNLITVNESLVVRNNTRDDYLCLLADPNEDVLDCRYSVQRRASGSQDLKPEQSTNTSIGFVWDIGQNLTVTLDFWSIEKEDTIGLFGEENHSILDALLRSEGGCSGNPVIGRIDPDDDQIAVYTAAGLCPAGDIEFVEDNYTNLDTRLVEGHDIGVYYDIDTGLGDFSFRYVGSFYDTYEQEPGTLSQMLLNAQASGQLPADFPITGFADLIGMDGNQDEKHNATLRWSKNDWGAGLTYFKLGSFYQSSLTLSDGTKYIIPSMSTWNLNFDYRFDMLGADNRVRLGINNVANERAPLADRYFGYFSDAHRDLGRYFYLDLRMAFR